MIGFQNLLQDREEKILVSNLESWRGLLAWIVVFDHFEWIIVQGFLRRLTFLSDFLTFSAAVSVGLFFLISGICIGFSIKQNSQSHFKFGKYLISRATRIYFPLLAALLLSICLMTILVFFGSSKLDANVVSPFTARTEYKFGALDLTKQLFFIGSGLTQVNGALWSLSTEWWLYISAMLLILAINSTGRLDRTILSGSLIIALILARVLGRGLTNAGLVYGLIWFLGFGYMFLLRTRTKNLLLLLLGFLAGFAVCGDQLYFGFLGSEAQALGYMFSICIISLPVIPKVSLGNFLGRVGESSYSTYILHFPILLFMYFAFSKVRLGVFGLTSLAALSLAIVSGIALLSAKYLENRIFLASINSWLYQRLLARVENWYYRGIETEKDQRAKRGIPSNGTDRAILRENDPSS